MDAARLLCDRPSNSQDAWYVPQPPPRLDIASDLMRLMGVSPDDCTRFDDVPISAQRVRSGTVLFREGAVAQSIYFVAVGTFKLLQVSRDGYEQVLGFAGRADALGYDAVYEGRHPTAAIALEDSTVYVLALNDLLVLCQRVPALERALHLTLSRQLQHLAEIANLMAAVSAEVRVARFLVQLSEEMAKRGQSSRRLLLRMSRRDIASHIGVAHETVSRSLGVLMQWGFLKVCGREVEILDLDRLKACACSTRGLTECPLPRMPRHRLPAALRHAGEARATA